MAPSVIVVGAGVVGACIAYRLAQGGAKVTLVDRGEPGRGTSSKSFAWINSNDKPPLAYHQLNAESVIAHRRLRDDVGKGSWLHEGGGLEWADSPEGGERLLAKTAQLREWGYRVEALTAAEAQVLEPHLRLDGLTAATLCPDEAWVQGPRLATSVATAAVALGASLRTHAEVTALEREGERITGLELGGGERVAAEWVVIAAGRWTDRVAALADVDVPLAPTYGLLAVTSPVAKGVSRVVHAPGMNFRPEPAGGLVLQSGETDAMVTEETVPDPQLPGCAILLDRLKGVLPTAAEAQIVEARVGVRPMPSDGFPLVGPVRERPGLYLAVTHSGITLSPLLGEIVASELNSGRSDPRLDSFRPARLVRAR